MLFDILLQNFEVSLFSKDDYLNLISLWIVQHFKNEKFDLNDLKLLSCGQT